MSVGDAYHKCINPGKLNANPRVFFDVEIDGEFAGRMIFELWQQSAPKTVENFRALCTGEKGEGGQGKPLHYLNSKFHRIFKDFVVQGGDVTNGDGTGGDSIYGQTFPDETTTGRHSGRGVLAMANKGPDTNASQFYILLAAAPHLDGKHVVFGRCIVGLDVLGTIEDRAGSDSGDALADVTVVGCGQLCPCGSSAYDENTLHGIPPSVRLAGQPAGAELSAAAATTPAAPMRSPSVGPTGQLGGATVGFGSQAHSMHGQVHGMHGQTHGMHGQAHGLHSAQMHGMGGMHGAGLPAQTFPHGVSRQPAHGFGFGGFTSYGGTVHGGGGFH